MAPPLRSILTRWAKKLANYLALLHFALAAIKAERLVTDAGAVRDGRFRRKARPNLRTSAPPIGSTAR
jgi:hypothetical protein